MLIPHTAMASDTQNHWAKDIIAEVRSCGIMAGTPDGFLPDNTITRAEFVTAVINAIGAEAKSGTSFSDVPLSQYYAPYIKSALELGIVGGFGDGTFRPENAITREEAVVILSKAFGYLSGYYLGIGYLDYEDITEGARGAFGYALKEKIISGYPDNTLRPKSNLTRAEGASLILRSKRTEPTSLGFVLGYPKLQDKGTYANMGVEISTNIPASVYYMLADGDESATPAPIAVNKLLVQTDKANTPKSADISGEIGKTYTLFLVAVAPDGRRSNVVRLENITPCPYTKGDGSISAPYSISSAYELDMMRYFPDKAFRLDADIALSGQWEPIEEFYGNFDGNGHRIEGLYVDTDKRYAGLFAKILKGEVKNLTVGGEVLAKANAGILAGELLDAKADSCVVYGRVKTASGNAGGLFGESAGRITNCLSAVYLVEADSFAGGISGQNYGIIESSVSATHTVMANMYAGGIAAVNTLGGRIERCVSANINVYDMIIDNCGRITANRKDGILKDNYAYEGMLTSSESGVNELGNNNGADISWEAIISKEALIQALGCDEARWEGGSKKEEYLIPHPTGALAPKLTKGVCEYAPLRISRASELLQMISNPDRHYMLVCDLTFTQNLSWTPVADTLSPDEGFSGTLDGNGHTIYGLDIKRSQNGLCGLIGMLSGGTVRDLTLSDITLTGGDIIGAVASISYGNIINCRVENMTIRPEEADAYIGGICGYNYQNVINCHAKGDITSRVKNVVAGGICAHNEGFIYGVSFSGDITTLAEQEFSESVTGGICGYNANGMIYNADATARLSLRAGTIYAGGCVAIQNGGEIYMCATDGFINASSEKNTAVSYAGGVCGLASGGILMHNYSRSDIIQYTPRSFAGGICGYNEGAVVQNAYSRSALIQEKPHIAKVELGFAGGICGYNDGGVIASTVALNREISSYGTTARVCASGTGDSIYDNFTIPYKITFEGEGTFAGELIDQGMLCYEFFTLPIAEGGRLGWSENVWQDGGAYPVF